MNMTSNDQYYQPYTFVYDTASPTSDVTLTVYEVIMQSILTVLLGLLVVSIVPLFFVMYFCPWVLNDILDVFWLTSTKQHKS